MTTKVFHEIRDPVHVFITLDSDERAVLDSRPVQRLRHIHQLAMEYLVYPGATHKRFEHALGVMELAGRVYDVVTRNDLIDNRVRSLVPEIANEDWRRYWRRVLRMAALCHDIGHLPFSHAAEHELLPEGWTHETITAELIRSADMQQIWQSVTPPLRTDDIVKLAVGPAKSLTPLFSDWELVLSEIVVGDAFGVDRMDYLLRDSLHVGVQYGRFDHYRLIDSLRILPKSADSEASETPGQPTLGLEEGGIHTAEALLLARYSMFSQVYLHPVRRAYDLHLKDFLREWLTGGVFQTASQEFLELTDIEVLAAIRQKAKKGSDPAERIFNRQHFKVAYSRNPDDLRTTPEPGKAIHQALSAEYGGEKVKHDNYSPSGRTFDFPVLQRNQRIASSGDVSSLLGHIPSADIGFVFVDPSIRSKARKFIDDNLQGILDGNVE